MLLVADLPVTGKYNISCNNIAEIGMEDVYIVSAKRTPIGKFGKSFSKLSAPELGAMALKGVLKDSGLPGENVEEVIMGNVIQAGVGQNPAGQAARHAGLSDEVTKYTVNVVCASGMLAIESAHREIALGQRDVVLAGGMESMSSAPFLLPSYLRWGPRQLLNKNYKVDDAMLVDGLMDAFYFEHMGFSAEKTGARYGLTREDADRFSVESQEKAFKAYENGTLAKELVETGIIDRDEGIRETSMEGLGKLVPAFERQGILTAGNSSQLSDGASALLMVSGKALKEYGLKPIARITGYESASLDPREFVLAPVPATKKLLEKMGKDISHFDLVEHNEAFSVASLVVREELGIEEDRFNVNGDAIAIGHPLGNSGSRIVVTLLNALRTRKISTGLATLCHGGGGGHSMALEVIE